MTHMEIIQVTPRGYCKGVTRAIALAKKTASDYPDTPIYVLGMLVHNAYVMEALKQLHIIPIDDKTKTRLELLDEIDQGVVIFTAHGIAPNVKEKALAKGLICVDASCPDVVKTQEIVKDALNKNYEIFYIGKQNHPEAEAVTSMSKHIHLITEDGVLPTLPSEQAIFVTNQTTMSIFDIDVIFQKIKLAYPHAVFCEEICNATRIRQQAVADLKGQNIDVLYVVGDPHSNNSNRLADIARDAGIPHVYLIDDVNGVLDEHIRHANKVAITSGASTPTYLTAQVIHYLKQYDQTQDKPLIDIQKII